MKRRSPHPATRRVARARGSRHRPHGARCDGSEFIFNPNRPTTHGTVAGLGDIPELAKLAPMLVTEGPIQYTSIAEVRFDQVCFTAAVTPLAMSDFITAHSIDFQEDPVDLEWEPIKAICMATTPGATTFPAHIGRRVKWGEGATPNDRFRLQLYYFEDQGILYGAIQRMR